MPIESTLKCDVCSYSSVIQAGWLIIEPSSAFTKPAIWSRHFEPNHDIPIPEGAHLICGPKCLARAVSEWAEAQHEGLRAHFRARQGN